LGNPIGLSQMAKKKKKMPETLGVGVYYTKGKGEERQFVNGKN